MANNEAELTVLTSKPFTEVEYDMQLKAYQQKVADHEKTKTDAYIKGRLEALVDKKEELNRLKRKMNGLPVLGEKKAQTVCARRDVCKGCVLGSCYQTSWINVCSAESDDARYFTGNSDGTVQRLQDGG